NTDDDSVSVLLSNGDGTLQAPVTHAVGDFPLNLVASDFNGDGHLDLAAPTGPSNVSVLLGNGDGTLSDPTQFDTEPRATPLVVDVDGDGTDDVLVVDAAGDILDRQGQPGRSGSFDPPVKINAGSPARDIAWVRTTDWVVPCSPASTPATTPSRSTPIA